MVVWLSLWQPHRDKIACAVLAASEQPSFLQQNIFQAIAKFFSNNKRPDLKSILS